MFVALGLLTWAGVDQYVLMQQRKDAAVLVRELSLTQHEEDVAGVIDKLVHRPRAAKSLLDKEFNRPDITLLTKRRLAYALASLGISKEKFLAATVGKSNLR